MSEQTCYGCKYLTDTFGNYVECKKTVETGTHMFVDWYYWNDGSPKECPLKTADNNENVADKSETYGSLKEVKEND